MRENEKRTGTSSDAFAILRAISRTPLSLLAATLVATLGCGTLKMAQVSQLDGSSSPAVATTATPEGSPGDQLSLRDDVPSQVNRENAPPSVRMAPDVVSVAYETPMQTSDAESYPIDETQYYGQPACVEECQGGCSVCSPTITPAPIRNVQEYIFDGGDQQPTVVIQKDWSAAGVDPTDTVIYYETLGGQVCVRPTNRVPIYAPRFGSVRNVTGAVLAARAVGTERILVPVQPGRLDDASDTGTVMQPLAPHGEQRVQLIDAFHENQHGTPIAAVVPPQRMSEALVPFEEYDILRTGKITDEEIAVLGRVLQNARTWFTIDSLEILIDGQRPTLILDRKTAQDVFVYEMPDKCAMRICKTASHTIASPGDIVSFTIRFDNSGVKPLGNAVIMDSLSPRLEYIDGSQQSSIDVRFSREPNDVGSDTLRWEVASPIEAGDGGVISFDCRIR